MAAYDVHEVAASKKILIGFEEAFGDYSTESERLFKRR